MSGGGDDWRLRGQVEGQDGLERARSLIHLHREGKLLEDVDGAVSGRVVVTHDGAELFAYAPDRQAIEAAGHAIEAALAGDGAKATLTLSHWDPGADEWVDPDASPQPEPARTGGDGGTAAGQTRTLVAYVGRGIRSEFEQSLEIYAGELGIQCTISEHPHLLGSQVFFTIAGPAHKLDEFAAGLAAEERQTIRTEEIVMASPL